MTMAQTWLKKITPQIFDELSLSEQGTLPPFVMDQFVDQLKIALNQEDLSIDIEKMDFIDGEKYFENLSNKTISIPLSLHPLSGQCFFLMGSNDVKTLIQSMIKEESTSAPTLQNDEMIKGLYTYFITEAIDSIQTLGIYKNLSLKIVDAALTDLSAFAIDLNIHIHNNLLPARLIVTKTLYKAIHNHFSFVAPTLENLNDMTNVNVPMSIRTGSITLKRSEWEKIEEGDFIVVDNTFYKPLEKKGSFQMMIGNNPILQVKMAKDGIKILDYLYFFNEETMDEDELMNSLDEDFSDDNAETSKEVDEIIKNAAEVATDLDDIDDDIDDDMDDDMDEDEDEDDLKMKEDQMLSPEKTNLSEIPLTINLEIARFSMSLEQLKKMTPGFKLPVTINPQHVNLVVSGKSIGTGEIIQLGETTGVRITKLN